MRRLKEEELLFPWMEGRGFLAHAGPLAVMRCEHEHGRDLRLALSLASDVLAESPGDAETRERYTALALRYVQLSIAHIQKEEGILFPLVDRLGQESGCPCLCRGELPEAELRWVAELEREANGWPAASYELTASGMTRAFERLCEEALG